MSSKNIEILTYKTEFSSAKVAQHFKSLYSDKFIFVEENLYYYTGIFWKLDNKKQAKLNNFIVEKYYPKLIKMCNSWNETNSKVKDEEIKNQNALKIHKFMEYTNRLLNHKYREPFIKDILCQITNDEIKFDDNPFLFVFKNKIFNLLTDEEIEPSPNLYLSLSTGYDYEETPKNKVDELDKFIDSIFPNKEIKDLYMTLIATGLDGVSAEKFIIANGSGGNGKGVLNELLGKTLGNYFYIFPSNILLKSFKTGSNPEVANMNNKRLCITREPDSESKLSNATIKELTGGSEVNARLNHSNNTKTSLVMTLIMECNQKPKLKETCGDDMARRILDIPFDSSFVSEETFKKLPDKVKNVNYFIGNDKYKSKEWQQENKLPLFELLKKYYKKYVANKRKFIIPEIIYKRNKEYMNNSDDIGNFIRENYRKMTDEDYKTRDGEIIKPSTETIKRMSIKLKYLYDTFKDTDTYKHYDLKAKQDLTYKTFQSKLEASLEFKFDIDEHKKTKILMGWKKGETNEDDDDDDEIEV